MPCLLDFLKGCQLFRAVTKHQPFKITNPIKNLNMKKKYNANLIKAKRSYTRKEVAELLKVNEKTCSNWIKQGLKFMKEDGSIMLIMGYDLKDFVTKLNKSRKTKLKPNEYFCVKCQKATTAKTGSEKIVKTGKTIGKNKFPQMKKKAICEKCGTKLNRFLQVSQNN